MASETSMGAASGAAAGAAAGAVAGPIGAAIGAVIGGAIGYFSGAEKKIAKKYARKAAEQKRLQQTMALAIARRDLVRQQRIARAQAVAAGASDSGVTSSSVRGATSSTQMQGMSALQYFDTQVGSDNLFQQFSKKAGKHSQNAQALDTLLAAGSDLATIGADLYGMTKRPNQAASPYTSFNNSAAQTNMSNNSAFVTFGSSLNLS